MQDWLIPPVPYSHARRLWRWVKHSYSPEVLAALVKNRNLRNIYAGRRCFVIGNGPSLSRQDLRVLSNEVTIVCNFFYKRKEPNNWQPTIYCAADPASSNLRPEHYENVFRLIEASAYVFDIDVLRKLYKLHSEVPSLEKVLKSLYGIVFDDPLFMLSGPVEVDMTRPIPGVGHTPMLSLMVALYVGCNPIILIGVDHDYEYRYFRGDYKVSHFYAENDDEIEIMPVTSHLVMAEEVLKTYSSYDMIRKIARRMGVEIYDATEGGHLDTFPKVEYASLF